MYPVVEDRYHKVPLQSNPITVLESQGTPSVTGFFCCCCFLLATSSAHFLSYGGQRLAACGLLHPVNVFSLAYKVFSHFFIFSCQCFNKIRIFNHTLPLFPPKKIHISWPFLINEMIWRHCGGVSTCQELLGVVPVPSKWDMHLSPVLVTLLLALPNLSGPSQYSTENQTSRMLSH